MKPNDARCSRLPSAGVVQLRVSAWSENGRAFQVDGGSSMCDMGAFH